MNDHHPCHRLTMIFATAIAHAARAFASTNLLIMHLTTIAYLSFYLFLLWHYLYLLSCAWSSPRHRPTLGWNVAIYEVIPFFARPPLHLMIERKQGFLRSPGSTPSDKDLRRLVHPDAAVGQPSWLIVSLVVRLCLLLASYRTVLYVQNSGYKTPGGKFFYISSKQNGQTLMICSEVCDRIMTAY